MHLRTSTAGILFRNSPHYESLLGRADDSAGKDMLGREKQLEVSLIWVLVNFVGIITGTLVAFFLYTLLAIRYDGVVLDQVRVLLRLAACGAVQGFIVSGLQTVVLLLSRLELLGWLFANVIGMAFGMMAPTLWAIANDPSFNTKASFDRYVVAGWLLSWIISGALGGWLLGKVQNRRIRWALLNAAAYLYWGLATGLGMKLLEEALQDSQTVAWRSSLISIGLMLVIGAWLHSYVFKGVARTRYRP
ncbi:MAG: hypothetical protein AAF703_08120 [Cyanobacteria bacterium P01_D01_bin.105]